MRPAISARFTGFTLIELAIVLVVLGILLMLGLPSFSALLQNAQVRTAATSIESGLQIARAEAVRLNAQVAFTLNGNDWSVDVVTPAKNVQMRSGKEAAPKAVVSSSANPITFNGMGLPRPEFHHGRIDGSGHHQRVYDFDRRAILWHLRRPNRAKSDHSSASYQREAVCLYRNSRFFEAISLEPIGKDGGRQPHP